MILIMIEAGATLIHEIKFTKESNTFMQDANLMSFELQNNDYSSLVQGKYMNEFHGNNDAQLYHELGNYTEAAFHYKVYSNKGYEDRAKEQKEIMDNARNEMGKLEVFADKVDDFLR